MMTQLGRFGVRAWAETGGSPDLLDAVEATSPRVSLSSRLDVVGLAADSVAVSTLAIHEFMLARGMVASLPPVRVSGDRVATSIRSDRFFRMNGDVASVWGELSGFFEAADGWVRTHANYPHHDAALRSVLGVSKQASRADVARIFQSLQAQGIEDLAAEMNAIAVRVRSANEWAGHAQAADLALQPLVSYKPLGAPGVAFGISKPSGELPLSGVRVLDLTRVIAGPIATRDLAFAGADVLRIDPPHLPEIGWQHLDTGQGKRSALLDLASRSGHREFDALLNAADIVVMGYRPGALEDVGLTPEMLAEKRPGLIIGQVSAWGNSGPWAQRRGFDSIVQAVSGISLVESQDGVIPGALPAQALDHAAGHLLAAGLVRALIDREKLGEGRCIAVALARIAQELLSAGVTEEKRPEDTGEAVLQFGRSGATALITAAPVVSFAGAPCEYPAMAKAWGTDPATWS